jgi:hypothetical protein
LGRVWSEHQAEFWAKQQRGQLDIGKIASARGIYIHDYAMLCDGYMIYFHVVNKFNFC